MLNLVIEFVECDCFLLKSSLDSMFQGTFSKTPSLFCKRNSHMCLYIFFDQRHTCRGGGLNFLLTKCTLSELPRQDIWL